MTNIASSTTLMEKSNNDNYDTWSMRIKYYTLGQDLWSVGGVETIAPTDKGEKKKWKIKLEKLYMYFPSPQRMSSHNDSKTSKLRNMLGILLHLYLQGRVMQNCNYWRINSCQFNKVTRQLINISLKSICNETGKLDSKCVINEARKRRIIIHGLNPKYHGIVIATRGWSNEPTLTELANILANRKSLDKQMCL